MPTYDAEILADNPVAYWKLEDLSGTTMLDSSGFGRDGTIFTSSPGPPTLGVAGPIETDALSLGGSGAYGYYASASGSETDLRDDFTWEIWGKTDDLVQDYGLLDRNGSLALNGSNLLAINSGSAWMRVSSASGLANTFDLGSPIAANAWVHLFGTRISNVIRLYVNGLLKDERTDFPSSSIVYADYNSGDWTIGALRTSLSGGGYDKFSRFVARAALYASALSAGRALAHYEAAKAVLPLSATIYVRFPVELDTDQVDPIDFPFTHNFANAITGEPNPLTEIISYKTNLNQSEPDYQQRVNSQPHHTQRFLEYAITAVGQQRSRLQASLWTPGETYKLPIAKDWGNLTATANATDTTLSLDTTLREYEVGSYAIVWSNVFDASTSQTFKITSVADDELGITPEVPATLPSGSVVMPARLASLPDDELNVKSHMIDRETAVLQFEILSTEVDSRRKTAYTPSETYLSEEVFTLERAKVEWVDETDNAIRRRKQETGTHTGNDYQRAIDTGSPGSIPLRVTLATRESQSEFLGWMDARQGSQNPVWVRSEDNDLQVLSRTLTSITITNIGYTTKYRRHSARRDLAILKTDGTWVYKRITDAVDNGDGTETLSVSSAPTVAQTSKICFLKRCCAPDRFEIVSHRNGAGFIAECEFTLTELLTTPEA